MSYDPLTDPTSLIAYRLAHGDTMTRPKARPGSAGGAAPAAALIAIAGLIAVGALVFAFALVVLLFH